MELGLVKGDANMKTRVVNSLPEYLERMAKGEQKLDVAVLGRLVRVLAGYQ